MRVEECPRIQPSGKHLTVGGSSCSHNCQLYKPASCWWTGEGISLNLFHIKIFLSSLVEKKLNWNYFSKFGDRGSYKKKEARSKVEMNMKIEKGRKKEQRQKKVEE